MNDSSQFFIGHGLTFLFLVVLVEQMGLPIPAMPWLLAAGALSAAGKFNPLLGVTATVIACILGDTLWFHLGRRHGAHVLSWLCRISLQKDSCVRRTQNAFSRYGLRGLLVSKFVPGLNTVAAPFAGMAGVGLNQFIAVDAIGSLAYATCCIGVGYFFSNQVGQIGAIFAHFGGDALRVLLGLVVLYIAYKYWQRKRLMRKLRMARISVEDLHQRMEAGEKPVILDLRSAAELKADPAIIQGAIHLGWDQVVGYSDQLPRDQDIIAYCSCPNEFTAAHTALQLQKRGITRIRPLLGGIDAWRSRNYPTSIWTTGTVTLTPDTNTKVEIVANPVSNVPDVPV